MTFYIQLGVPRITGKHDANDSSLNEAMQTAFEAVTEDAFLVWCHIPISLGYKYVLSFMMEDILAMVGNVLHTKEGNMEIAWASNEFRCDWRLTWSVEIVNIDVTWDLIADPLQEVLSKLPKIEVSRHDFLAEWGGLIQLVMKALQSSGYSTTVTQPMADLLNELRPERAVGCLYQHGRSF